MTVAELSRICGIPRMTLNNIEKGHREGLTVAEMQILAIALNVPPAVFHIPPGVREVESSPGIVRPVTELVAWLADPASDVTWIDSAGYVEDAPQVRRVPDAMRVRRLLNHYQFMRAYQAAPPDSARAVNSWNLLVNTRQQMRDNDEIVPDLPPDLAEMERRLDEESDAIFANLSFNDEGDED